MPVHVLLEIILFRWSNAVGRRPEEPGTPKTQNRLHVGWQVKQASSKKPVVGFPWDFCPIKFTEIQITKKTWMSSPSWAKSPKKYPFERPIPRMSWVYDLVRSIPTAVHREFCGKNCGISGSWSDADNLGPTFIQKSSAAEQKRNVRKI